MAQDAHRVKNGGRESANPIVEDFRGHGRLESMADSRAPKQPDLEKLESQGPGARKNGNGF